MISFAILICAFISVQGSLVNIIQNGDFNSPSVPGSYSSSIPNWGGQFVGVSDDNTFCSPSGRSGQFAYLSGYNAQMSQLIYLNAGVYTFSWYDAGSVSCGSEPVGTCTYNIQLYENVAGVGDNVYYRVDLNAGTAWTLHSYSVTITRADYYNIFVGVLSSSCAVLIDSLTLLVPASSTTGTTGTTGTPATTGTTGIFEPSSSQDLCDAADQSAWTYGQGFYCYHGQMVQCWGSAPYLESSVQNCAAGSTCQCSNPMEECSNHGTQSPCA